MENNKEFTPEESLQLISQVIANTRNNIKHTSFFFLFWGWIMTFSSLTCFFLIRYFVGIHQYDHINMACWIAWSVPTAIGIAVQIYYLQKLGKTTRVRSQLSAIIRTLWYANFVALMIICYLCNRLNIYPTPLILVLTGLSTFLTGRIIDFKPLMYGGLVFAIAAILAVLVRGDYQLLIVAVAIVLGYLVPGYILKYGKA